MNYKKKGISLILSAAMIAGCMAACGNSESDSKETTAAGGNETETVAETKESADIAEINMLYPSMGPIPSGLAEVEAAINEITEAEINTHVNLEMIETGSYAQQVGLKMSSGESLDLMLTLPMDAASFTSVHAQNQVMDITDLLDEYGQGIKDLLGDKLKGTSENGRVYGVTGNRTYVISTYIIMRTDVLEDLGLLEKAENMTSLDEYEEILEAVKTSDKWKNLAGIVSSDGQGTCLAVNPGYLATDTFADAGCYDALGDNNFIISVNPENGDTTIRNNFATEEYKAMYEKMRDWYEKGYVYKDSETNSEMAEQLIKSNVAFSYFGNCEEGVETLKSTQCGMPVTCVKIKEYPVTTSSLTKFVWTIPNASKEPEAAMTFLNMMFTDPRIANLLAWGVEGRDYEVVDGVAGYVDGKEGAYHAQDFLFGNQFITLPWQGDSADFREKCEAVEKNAALSPYLGFTADTSEITNEIAAVTNVLGEFKAQVNTGSCDEETYQAFVDKLESVNVDKIIQTYQEQLDAWLEEGGK